MKSLKKSFVLIALGIINILHASLHIVQFIQSIVLIKASIELQTEEVVHHKDFISEMLHSPYFTLLWGLIGILTLWIGIKDFIHHKKCKNG